MYAKAIFVGGKIVTGRHHGEAFSLLTPEEKDSNTLLSGFWDEHTGRFFSDEASFYTKKTFLIRHSIPSCDYEEHPDPDLSPEGIEKVHRVASYLKGRDLSGYQGITSPYLRCLVTAEIISRVTGLQFTVDVAFAEAGEENIVLQNHASDFPQFRWPTGDPFQIEKENDRDFQGRLEEAAKVLPGKSVVISHFRFIRSIATLVSGSPVAANSITPASLTYIDNNQIVHIGKQF